MKRMLFTVAVLFFCGRSILQAAPPGTYKFSIVKNGQATSDTASIVTQGDRVIFTVNKQQGSGSARVDLINGQWPEEFVFCFEGFREFRSCHLTIDNHIFNGHLPLQFGQLQFPHEFKVSANSTTKPLAVQGPPSSPEITRMKLTHRGNNIELELKVSVDAQKVKTIQLYWEEKRGQNAQQIQNPRNRFLLDVF